MRGGGTCLNAPSRQFGLKHYLKWASLASYAAAVLRHLELGCLLLPKTSFCAKWPLRAGSINFDVKNINRLRIKSAMTSYAFTLAEVLITLGIIGVVAAIVLPGTIHNIQDYTFKNQWKKAYSDFSRAALTMAEDYQVDTFKEVIEIEAPNYGETPNIVTGTVSNVINKYFKLIKYSANNNGGWNCWSGDAGGSGGIIGNVGSSSAGINYKYLNGVDAGYWVFGYHPTACFVAADYVFGVDTNTSSYGRFSIDVNGSKPPNVVGRDVFVININNLRKPVVGGGEGFYDSADYFCDKNASKGGPACSAKYLLE